MESKGPLVLGVCWFMMSLVVITTVFRISTRINVLKNVGLDDYVMVVAALLQLASTVLLTVSVHYGLGNHLLDLLGTTPENIPILLKVNWESTIPAILASVVARISIAILLIRLFGTRTWFRWYVYIITALGTILNFIFIILTWTRCNPVQAMWDFTIPAQCHNINTSLDFGYAAQSLYTLYDLTLVLFPVMFVWKLNMKLSLKLSLMAIFSGGLFAMGCSIVKLTLIKPSLKSTDPTYDEGTGLLWTNVEQTLVIILGNIPPLRAFPRHQFESLRSFGSSLLLRSWRTTGNASGRNTTTNASGRNYHDLELGSQRIRGTQKTSYDSATELAKPDAVFPDDLKNNVTKVYFTPQENRSTKGLDNRGITRDDTYEVAYAG